VLPVDDDATESPRRPRKEQSLLARALGYLARREHSRAELRRKLAPHAESADEVDRLLDELETRKLLSDRRFTEVMARSRGERFGAARVKQELRARGVSDPLVREAVGALSRTELQRAREVWRKKFDAPPADAAERARQMRFLAQRGFSSEVIRRVVGNRGDD
jgi:regulatory protein